MPHPGPALRRPDGTFVLLWCAPCYRAWLAVQQRPLAASPATQTPSPSSPPEGEDVRWQTTGAKWSRFLCSDSVAFELFVAISCSVFSAARSLFCLLSLLCPLSPLSPLSPFSPLSSLSSLCSLLCARSLLSPLSPLSSLSSLSLLSLLSLLSPFSLPCPLFPVFFSSLAERHRCYQYPLLFFRLRSMTSGFGAR